jgi:hypothetical protein
MHSCMLVAVGLISSKNFSYAKMLNETIRRLIYLDLLELIMKFESQYRLVFLPICCLEDQGTAKLE